MEWLCLVAENILPSIRPVAHYGVFAGGKVQAFGKFHRFFKRQVAGALAVFFKYAVRVFAANFAAGQVNVFSVVVVGKYNACK